VRARPSYCVSPSFLLLNSNVISAVRFTQPSTAGAQATRRRLWDRCWFWGRRRTAAPV